MEFTSAEEYCPGCHRHCPLSNPGCHVGRAIAYSRTMYEGYGTGGYGAYGAAPARNGWQAHHRGAPWMEDEALGAAPLGYDQHRWDDGRPTQENGGFFPDTWREPHRDDLPPRDWDGPHRDDVSPREWEPPRRPHRWGGSFDSNDWDDARGSCQNVPGHRPPRDLHDGRMPGWDRRHDGPRDEWSSSEDTEETLLIRRFQHCAHLLMHRLGREGGRARAIMALAHCERGCMSQRELARRLDIRSASVSELLAKMEESRLITRMPDPHDRRVVLVKLTGRGRAEAEHVAEQRRKANEDLFSDLSDEERSQLEAILEKLDRYWRDEPDREEYDQGFPDCEDPRA